ncbi:MAG: hypothetical protein R3F30_08440 [Planctomycetota bacterium]
MIRPLSLLVLAAALAPSIASAQAEDGTKWRMTVTPGKLKPITIPDRIRTGDAKTYWYTVLEIKNETGKERNLGLAAKGLTEVKKSPVILPGLYPEVTKAIQQRERDKDIVNLFEASGEIGDGETKKVLVLFANLDTEVNLLDLRVKGLANTLYKEGSKVYYEDTELSVKFHRIGDEYEVTRQRVEIKEKRWVEVERKKVRD